MAHGSSSWLPRALDQDASIEIFKATNDRGMNKWDTADIDSKCISEEAIGKALKKHRTLREKTWHYDQCCIFVLGQPNIFTRNASPELQSSRLSLHRLGTNCVDLYQIHCFDPYRQIEEMMQALRDLLCHAKSSRVCNSRHQRIARPSLSACRIITISAPVKRSEKRNQKILQRTCCRAHPWSPKFSSKLANPFGEKSPTRAQSSSLVGNEIISRVERAAKQNGWKMSQVALFWLLGKGTVLTVRSNPLPSLVGACDLR
ncbi:hypothetical protein N7523_005891 [Penicillium sp. IBT 18751x]|nr:hypothetical protein N7523_005891 [Penicillium sp. IBT 18751x]